MREQNALRFAQLVTVRGPDSGAVGHVVRGASSSQRASESGRLACLDGLRGIAVLLVFLEHSTIGHEFLLRRDMNFSGIGRSGVFLFFVLSSYLLTGSLLRTGLSASYFVRRFLRIAPLYYTVLLGLVIYQGIIGGPDHHRYWMIHVDGGVRGFVKHFLFLKGDFLFWTIPVEMQSYLLLPVWFLLLRWGGAAGAWLLAAVAGCWGVTAYLANTGAITNYLSRIPITGSLSSYDVFIAGALLAWTTRTDTGVRYGRRRWAYDAGAAFLLVAVLAATFCLSTPQFLWFEMVHPHLIYNSIAYAIVWSAILYSAVNDNRYLSPLLRLRWLRTIGVCGFSWYLLHVVVFKVLLLTVAERLVNQSWINFAIALVATYVLCLATYRWIERPFLRLWRLPPAGTCGSDRRSRPGV